MMENKVITAEKQTKKNITNNIPTNKDLHYKLRLFIKGEAEGDAFGPGIADLMRGVQKYGSLLKAAESMHMAYSKAWKIIHKVECNLGFQLIFRQVGRGCGSTITPDGQRFLDAYDRFIREVSAATQASFEKNFADFLE